MNPYRYGDLDLPPPAPQYGLIVGPRVAHHRCSPPGFWRRLFRRVPLKSLWRCSKCGKVWQACSFFDSRISQSQHQIFSELYWTDKEVDLSTWIDAGGAE